METQKTNIKNLLKKADMYEKIDNMSETDAKKALETLIACSGVETLSFIYQCIM